MQNKIQDLAANLNTITDFKASSKKLNPLLALEVIVEFYKTESIGNSVEADNDMLLFQHGTYDWDGTGETFQVNFTRQIIDDINEDMYQIGLTLYYQPNPTFKDDYNKWCESEHALSDWMTEIKASNGFQLASDSNLIRHDISVNHI